MDTITARCGSTEGHGYHRTSDRLGFCLGNLNVIVGIPAPDPFVISPVGTIRGDDVVLARLEDIRSHIEAEDMSYGDIAELADLARYIDPSDVQLMEWAGVPEFHEDDCATGCERCDMIGAGR